MPHPSTRLLAVLELLQAHGQLSGADLARRLEVDPRTVRRYISTLEEMGVPIASELGRHGAYSLVAGYKLPPMMFTDDEALALSLGLVAARGLGIEYAAPAVASAQAKLERVLPANIKRRVRAIHETVTLELARPAPESDNAALVALSTAAQSERRVHFRYAGPADESERDFDPYGVAYRRGCWYAVGWCHLRKDLRSFRLDRMRSVQVLEKSFKRPRGFDVLGHLTKSLATIPRRYTVEVLLRTDLQTAQREVFAAAGIFEQRERGVLLRSQCDDLTWFARELARLPFRFEIVSPRALRGAVAKVGKQLVECSLTPPLLLPIPSSPSRDRSPR